MRSSACGPPTLPSSSQASWPCSGQPSPASALVIFSPSGFSPGAKSIAETQGIALYTLDTTGRAIRRDHPCPFDCTGRRAGPTVRTRSRRHGRRGLLVGFQGDADHRAERTQAGRGRQRSFSRLDRLSELWCDPLSQCQVLQGVRDQPRRAHGQMQHSAPAASRAGSAPDGNALGAACAVGPAAATTSSSSSSSLSANSTIRRFGRLRPSCDAAYAAPFAPRPRLP